MPGAAEQSARIALVHPLIESVRGGEKVFFELARMYPHADLFTLHYRPGVPPPDILVRLRTSFLQSRLLRRMPFRAYLPLLPRAVASLPTASYDLVVSTSSGWSHGAPSRRHLCYMFTPPRYIWHEAAPSRTTGLASAALRPLFTRLQRWDVAAASRVDRFIVISEIAQARVKERYGRDAELLAPPADVDRWLAMDSGSAARRDYVVAAGELVPYKRFDLAVRACKAARLPLVVVGDGPQRRLLRRLAGDGDVRFLGRVDDTSYARAVAGARVFVHPGIEDFGIGTVEALAAGVPVVGNAAGGTGEIVTDGCGVLVEEPTVGTLAAALTAAMQTSFDSEVLRARAREFSTERFRTAMAAAIDEMLGGATRPSAPSRGETGRSPTPESGGGHPECGSR